MNPDEYLHMSLKKTPVVMWAQDRDLRYTWLYNPSMGLSVDQVIGRTDFDLLDPVSASELERIKQRVLTTGEPARELMRIVREGNEEFHDISLKALREADDSISGIAGLSVEVSHLIVGRTLPVASQGKNKDKKGMDGSSPSSRTLQRAELLSRETHHRVKNSLAMVAGFLRVQRQGLTNEEARNILAEAESRVRAIDAVHDHLARSPYESINLGSYLRSLCANVSGAMCGAERLSYDMAEERIGVNAEKAVHIGMILTELLTNALKYGAIDEHENSITISLRKNPGKLLVLSVADSGHGLPENFKPEESTGLGMRIITSLVRGLDGELRAEPTSQGARFVVELPMPP